jgi:hypothetical protein
MMHLCPASYPDEWRRRLVGMFAIEARVFELGEVGVGDMSVASSRRAGGSVCGGTWGVTGDLLATSPCQPVSVATRARKARTDVELDGQLDLFDGLPGRPLLIARDELDHRNRDDAVEIVHPSERAGVSRHASGDHAVLRAFEEALADAREAGDDRPALVVLASCLGVLGAPSTPPEAPGVSLRQAGEDWLRRLETQQKSGSTLVGYRVAIDDLLEWSETNGRDILTEAAIVDYLHSYQERAQPAEASYYRRFVLLRKFVRWVCRRDGVPDPFLGGCPTSCVSGSG